MSIEYPTRCQIVDATGMAIAPGIVAKSPEVSVPHIGEFGWAYLDGRTVCIELDSGVTLMGYECWWIPVER